MYLMDLFGFQVANAVGAALSQVSGTQDVVCSLEADKRESLLDSIKREAIEIAVKAGADGSKTKVSTSYKILKFHLPQEWFTPANLDLCPSQRSFS